MSRSRPETITKKELVNRIAERTKQTKVVVKDVIQRFLDEIIDELADGNRLEFREFGVFEVKERAARRAQNPRTLEKVYVPAKRVVKFKVGRMMRERVGDDDDEDPPAPTRRAAGSKADAARGAASARTASRAGGAGKRPASEVDDERETPRQEPPTSNSPF